MRGHCIDKDVWTATVGKEFISCLEEGRDHDRHTVVVDRQGSDRVLVHVLSETLSTALFALEHRKRCITSDA